MTGQYSHVNGALDLYCRLPSEKHYLLKEMKQGGYATAVIGKWHLTDAPGYVDYFAILPGQGKYMNPIIQVSEGGKKQNVIFDRTCAFNVNVVESQGHSSDVLTDISLNWLDEKRNEAYQTYMLVNAKYQHILMVAL